MFEERERERFCFQRKMKKDDTCKIELKKKNENISSMDVIKNKK